MVPTEQKYRIITTCIIIKMYHKFVVVFVSVLSSYICVVIYLCFHVCVTLCCAHSCCQTIRHSKLGATYIAPCSLYNFKEVISSGFWQPWGQIHVLYI